AWRVCNLPIAYYIYKKQPASRGVEKSNFQMKHILTLLLVSGVIYLSSCGNGANDPIPVLPKADSASYGSYLSIWFQSDTFFIRDLTLNGIPAVTIHSSATYNATD